MLENLYMYISLASVSYGIYILIMRPITLRYQSAFNHLLGKEIARRLYQTIYPDFTYDTHYQPGDHQSELILESALEEFIRIHKEKEGEVQ
ncbi:MAG: hypothetical protein EOM50_20290 [Erysipelotrichia bacterium]|nr:hypothetical protein [Erysipelotrichia bacterium]NCC55328.1 hypothetical protein [Erysipelotrichia bacterium]